jgi:hypothetical protein
MKRHILALVGALGLAASSPAALVIADFNDMALGDMRSSNVNQSANTGTGFSDAYWAVNTSVPKIVSGNLIAPAATNYALVQSGTAQSMQATIYTINDATDRRQARNIATVLEGVVWFSFLVQNAGANQVAGIDFNRPTNEFSIAETSPRRVVLEGTTLKVFQNGGMLTGNVDVSALAPLGQTALIVGRIDIAGDQLNNNDMVSVWVNPALPTTSPYDMPVATWTSSNTDFLGTATSISTLGVLSYDTGTGSGQVGGKLDAVRLASGENAYYYVTGIPEPATYAAMLGLGALGLAVWRRRRAG